MLWSSRSSAALGGLTLPVDWRKAAAWLLLAGFVQATVLHFAAVRGAVPSLVFLVVATYAVRAGVPAAILFGVAGGILEDALAGNTGAAWTLATTVSALGIALASRILFTDSVSIFAALVVVATLAREALYWSALSLEGYPVGLGAHYAKLAVASALYTGLAALAVAWARWRFKP
ncbi:MAG: rod shape-determining protein MreD [Candidatus Eremiobacteraeota bacterium]|nr:rod shape-determining protein MreD [Candidatus Eremiobacteraeota bacterium]